MLDRAKWRHSLWQASLALTVAGIHGGRHSLWQAFAFTVAGIHCGMHPRWQASTVAGIRIHCGGHSLWQALTVACTHCGRHSLWQAFTVAGMPWGVAESCAGLSSFGNGPKALRRHPPKGHHRRQGSMSVQPVLISRSAGFGPSRTSYVRTSHRGLLGLGVADCVDEFKFSLADCVGDKSEHTSPFGVV